MTGKITQASLLRVGVVTTHPIQYFSPVYRALARQPGIQVSILYRALDGAVPYYDRDFGTDVAWDGDLLQGLRYEVAGAGILGAARAAQWTRRNLFDVLIVHGYNTLHSLGALLGAKFTSTQVLLRGDSQPQTSYSRGDLLKKAAKRKLLTLVDGAIAIGTRNEKYLREHGIPSDRIYFSPMAIDDALLGARISNYDEDRVTLRKRLDIPEKGVVLISVGKLVARKRIGDVIEAVKRLRSEGRITYLLVVGSGPQNDELQSLAKSAGIDSFVRFVGFQNQSGLHDYYCAADIFVHTAEEEPWGLVVNEALLYGLPVVVSDGVGAADDLVTTSNGRVFHCGDIAALVECLMPLVDDPNLRASMSDASLSMAANWGIEASAMGIAHATRQSYLGQAAKCTIKSAS